jgi:hypothetical protein
MKDWKTTVSGLCAGLFPVLGNVFPKYASIFQMAGSVALMLLGYHAADASSSAPTASK